MEWLTSSWLSSNRADAIKNAKIMNVFLHIIRLLSLCHFRLLSYIWYDIGKIRLHCWCQNSFLNPMTNPDNPIKLGELTMELSVFTSNNFAVFVFTLT